MLSILAAIALTQTTKLEPVLGGVAEIVAGLHVHPPQTLGLYMRRSQINAYFNQAVRQAANDPWIRVGETTTTVKEATTDGLECLLLESTASREILTNNPLEGQVDIGVKRKIVRSRKLWVAEDGLIVKNWFQQSLPDAFTVEMQFGNGFLVVNKTQEGKTQAAQVDITIDPVQFEDEFLTMAYGGKVLKQTKKFAMLDPFLGGVRQFEATTFGPFRGLEGKDPIKGVRVDIKEGKGVSTAWVTDEGRLLQYDLATGERLIVEPKEGDPGVSKVRIGGG
jgi:hypothetical protein